jgi:hypothetical protein
MLAATPAGLHHFESHLGAFREHLEVEVSRMTAAAQQLTETQGWWSDPQQVSTWLAHGWHMVGTWLAHGWHMVGTWLAHGLQKGPG